MLPESLPATDPDPPRFIGLDVHKRQFTACLLEADGKTHRTLTLPLTRERLLAFARDELRVADQVALEATTNCWAVAELLRDYVHKVVVSNPLATKAIASAKVKTDKVDARVLAELLRCEYLPEVWQPDHATQIKRQLCGRRSGLVGQRTRLRNRIHSVLAMRLIEPPCPLFSKAGQAWLVDRLAEGMFDAEATLLIESDLDLLKAVQTQIDRVEDAITERAGRDERVKLLITLPGVDVTTAESLLAALGDVSRFASPEKAASYLGLVPSVRQSAKTCHHGPITRAGNSQARWMLIQAAQTAARHPGPLGHFFRRLKTRKSHNVAVVAVARKLVVIAMHMLTNNEPYRYAIPRSTETKLARLRVRSGGERRRSGPAKGSKSVAKLPGGSRTIRSLDGVYEREGLPARHAPSEGESRALAASGSEGFVAQIAVDHVIPRRRRKPESQPPRDS